MERYIWTYIAIDAIDKAIRDLPHINSSQLKTGYHYDQTEVLTLTMNTKKLEYMQSLFGVKTKLESVIKEN